MISVLNVPRSIIGTGVQLTALNAVDFISIMGLTLSATEALTDWSPTIPFRIKRFKTNVLSNTKGGNTVLGIRRNGVTITSLTYATLITGKQDSGAINFSILAGDLINFIVDTSASVAGSIEISYMIFEVEF